MIGAFFTTGNKAASWLERRRIKIGTLLLLLLYPLAGEAMEDVRLQLKWKHQFQFAGYYAAQEQGYYKDVGLNVEIIPSRHEENAVQQVLEGKAEFGVGTTELLLLREQGQPVVALAVIFQHSPLALITLKRDGVQSIHDLAGHKVMIEEDAAELYAYLGKEGVSPDSFTLLPHSLDTQDLLSGTVDAMSIYVTDEPFELRSGGHDYLLYSPRSVGIDFYGDNLFTSEQQLKQNPERVKAFREASLKGWVYAMANPEEIVQLIYNQYSQQHSIEHLRFEAAQMASLMQAALVEIGHMNPGRWQHIAETYADLGLMKPDFDLEDFLYVSNPPPPDLSWLPALMGGVSLLVLSVLSVAVFIYRSNVRLKREGEERKLAEKRIAALLEESNQSRNALLSIIEDEEKSRIAVSESEARYRTLFDEAQEGIFVMSLDGKLLSANESFARMHGYSPDEMEGFALADLVTPETAQYIPERMARLKKSDASLTFEVEHYHKDGQLFPLEVFACPIVIAGETVIQSFSHDITDRKKAEVEKDRLLAAIEQAAESMMITDVAGTIEYVNPAFEKISGYSREEVIGQKPNILKSGKVDSALYKTLKETLLLGKTWSGRLINQKKCGALYTEESTISPVKDASGKIVNYVAVKRDVTDELHLEEQLRQAQKMESIGQLVSGVAHDFNNILQIIIGYANLALQDPNSDHSVDENLAEITKAGSRAKDLVKQLLTFSRQEIISPVGLDLNAEIEHAHQMLARVIGEHIELKFEAERGLAPIFADKGQIHQILMNLCVNARDAMPDGGTLAIKTEAILITPEDLKTHALPQAGMHILLSIADTGCGMDQTVCERIFDPFFTTKGVGKGTGLGLSTVYGIVKQNGGHIEVESVKGRETIFKIYLPMIQSSPDAATDAAPENREPAERCTETILLAEDDSIILKLAGRFLSAAGYTVLTATDGKEAVRVFDEYPGEIDCVVIDVVMPRMGGKQAIEQILKKCPSVRYLFCSGYSPDAGHNDFIKKENQHLLKKPYQPETLLQKIREVLDAA